MAYRALRTFAGLVTMVKGEVREIENEEVAKDLLRCGFIEDLTPKKTKSEKAEEVPSPKPSPKKGKGEKNVE